MSSITRITQRGGNLARKLLTVLCAAGLLSVTSIAYCDEPVTLAPPVQADAGSSSTSSSTVFNWQEIPTNQNVPIQRACFDRGGYQLYDTVGETIIVPFTNDNLYVMKFAVSPDGSTYFVNTGTAPVLYLPDDGYLTNASDPTAHWYPFTQHWHPSTPVFVGIAPSWDDYVAMGWYPNMYYYGGYWCNGPFISVGAVFPAFGLFFQIGGAPYWGWGSYWHYCGFHPAPFHIGIYNANFYHWGGPGWHHYAGINHPFYGSGHPFVYGHGFVANSGRPFGASPAARIFRGTGRPYEVGHGFVSGAAGNGFHGPSVMAHQAFRGGNTGAFSGSGHVFRGVGSSGAYGHTAATERSYSASHEFRGASSSGTYGHSAATARSYSTSHEFRGASSWGGSHSYQGAHSYTASHSFQGAAAGRSSWGSSHSAGSSGHSFQGGGGSDNHHH
jgi:hypothetical protein